MWNLSNKKNLQQSAASSLHAEVEIIQEKIVQSI